MKKVLFSLLSVVMIALFLVSCAGGGEEKPVVTSEKVPGYLQFVMPDGTRARFFGTIIDPDTKDWMGFWMQNENTMLNLDSLNGPGDYFFVFRGYSVNDLP